MSIALLVCLFAGELPAPSGPQPVGSVVLRLVDESRADLLASERRRELCVQLWYPAKPGTGHGRLPYLVEDGLGPALIRARYLQQSEDVLGPWLELDTHAARESELAAEPARFPLLLLSHGFGVLRANYTVLAEELASHGYVVAAIDHPYLGFMQLGAGSVVSSADDPRDESAAATRVTEMAADARFVLGALLDEHSPAGRFAGRLDAQRVGMLGHSLGGAAALECGRIDSRFKACVDMDGAPFGAVEAEGVHAPYLVLLNEPVLAKRPPARMGEERHAYWVGLMGKKSAPAWLATIENTDHFTFSDAPFVCAPEWMAAQGGVLAPERGRELLGRLLRAFFATQLGLAHPEPLADAARAYPEVKLESLGR